MSTTATNLHQALSQLLGVAMVVALLVMVVGFTTHQSAAEVAHSFGAQVRTVFHDLDGSFSSAHDDLADSTGIDVRKSGKDLVHGGQSSVKGTTDDVLSWLSDNSN